MKTVKQMVAEIENSNAEYVTYGESNLGIAVKREDAIADIATMDDEQIGEGTWYECDEDGHLFNKTHERVIFDNGGGITVQFYGWAHYYDNEAQAAHDVVEWIKTHDTSDWDGHEDDALSLEPTGDDIRNGGYRVVQIVDLPKALESLQGWGNGAAFAVAFNQ